MSSLRRRLRLVSSSLRFLFGVPNDPASSMHGFTSGAEPSPKIPETEMQTEAKRKWAKENHDHMRYIKAEALARQQKSTE